MSAPMPGRSPFQLGKPVGAIVGPYRISSVQYQRHRGDHQQDGAGGGARLRPVADQLRHRARDRRGRRPLGLDRLEVRRRNLIRAEEFPYLIPSGTTYDSGDYHAVIDKVLAQRGLCRRWSPSATACARRGCSPASASRPAWSRAAATRPSSRCSTRRTRPPPGWIPAASASTSSGAVTATIHTTSAGQGHETLVGTVIGEVLEIDPDRIRVVRPDSLDVAAEQQPGRQPHGDHAGRRRLPRRAEAQGAS